jgi:two-component system, cell cycle sensor histidine kinase and response regulator CckA
MATALDRASLAQTVSGPGIFRRIGSFVLTLMPRGESLTHEAWQVRHRVILWILWGHAVALPFFGMANGQPPLHAFGEAAALAVCALGAGVMPFSKRLQTCSAVIGLMTASALLVHFSGGVIEMHFHFFVMVGIVTLYQSWTPFLLAITYVVLHHGIAGAIDPQGVYNHAAAISNPWKWAMIHGLFILGMSGAGLAAWKFSEDAQQRAVEVEKKRAADMEKHLRQRDEMDAALRSNEERFRSLVQYSSDCISISTADNKIAYISPSIERVLGYTPDELMGAVGYDFVHPQDISIAKDAIARVLQHPNATVKSEYRVRAKDGSWRWLEITRTNLLHHPSIEGIVSNFHDITDRRSIEMQLRQAQKMDAVGRLAGGIAHDFNNVLSVISNYAAFLQEDVEGEDLKQDVKEIQDASAQAAGLIRQLLTFSRQEVVETETMDLNAVVADTHKLLSRTIGEDMDLIFSPQDDLWPVHLDATQAAQLLMNLAVNARDAMPMGGKLTIRTMNFPAERADDMDYVVLEVSDNGIGIPEDVQQNMFDPFFTTKPRGSGTGLGLSTVFGIVETAGGYIEVDSEVGSGTAFSIYLPRDAKAHAEPEVEAPTNEAVVDECKTILVVEDEEALRRVTHRILVNAGYDVLLAASGEEALEVFRANPDIDLVMTDVIMPGMSGKDLVSALRERRPDVRSFYTSGYAEDIIAQRGELREGEVLLQKPFDPPSLLSKIRCELARVHAAA